MSKAFDNEFTMLTNVATVQAQTKHDASLLNSIRTNIRNDIETLNVCIKVLRQSMEEGKYIYAKCSLAYLHLHSFDDQIKAKIAELQTLTDDLLKPDQKLVNFEHAMEIIHDNIQGIQVVQEKALRIFSLLRDHLSP